MMQFDCSSDIVLENDRVQLAPLQSGHLKDLLPIAIAHPSLLQYSPSAFGSEEALSEYIANAIALRTNGMRYPFVIYDKNKQQFAGSTSFGNISNKNQRLEIGWTWIGKAFQRTGLNRNCKFLLLSYAFENLGAERVELKTDSRNAQSRKAIEKIGAIYEGELRSHTLMLDGYRRSTVYYSILKNEWPKVRQDRFSSIVPK